MKKRSMKKLARRIAYGPTQVVGTVEVPMGNGLWVEVATHVKVSGKIYPLFHREGNDPYLWELNRLGKAVQAQAGYQALGYQYWWVAQSHGDGPWEYFEYDPWHNPWVIKSQSRRCIR